jgi:hypothetical protein
VYDLSEPASAKLNRDIMLSQNDVHCLAIINLGTLLHISGGCA